jgi:hypothetical protein
MILLFGKNIGQLGVVPKSESVVLPQSRFSLVFPARRALASHRESRFTGTAQPGSYQPSMRKPCLTYPRQQSSQAPIKAGLFQSLLACLWRISLLT